MGNLRAFINSPSFIWVFAFVLVAIIGLLVAFLGWLVATRSRGDMGLTKKANRFKDLEGLINEAKKAYRQNEELRDLYYVARKSGARKQFVDGLRVAGERGGMSASNHEGALWLAQAIALDPENAERYFDVGKICLNIGKEDKNEKYLRIAHQAFTKAFLLRRGHVGAFEHLVLMSQMTDRLYGRTAAREESLADLKATRQPGEP
ncbi:MAG: hypothetical protein FJZ01_04580 [Candidatus Sericytochromatia bacterium]|nr:hypothetical protein [Candidatus Tanganyikabacteria bacterium]